MKRYFLCRRCCSAVALAVAGGALAANHRRPVLVRACPDLAPQSDAWLQRAQRAPGQPGRLAAARRSRSTSRARSRGSSRAQGCAAAKRHESGIVDPRLRQARLRARRLRNAPLLGPLREEPQDHGRACSRYAHGYVHAFRGGSTASIEIARGTSNYHPTCRAPTRRRPLGPRDERARPDPRREGPRRARRRSRRPTTQSPPGTGSFHQTRDFFHGFRAAVHGHTLV